MNLKLIITSVMISGSCMLMAQSNQVVNASNYLRNKEYDKAKASADAAIENADTKGSAKLWMYRGKIYQAIFMSKIEAENKLDGEAQEKSVESFVTCLKLDKDNIYKDEVKNLIVQSAASLNNKANYFYSIKEYEKALHCYDILDQALPFDFDEGMKRQNITKDKLTFNRYRAYAQSGNKEKTKELGNKMIDGKYKEPMVYIDMTKLYLLEKDTLKALDYNGKGRMLFEDNIDLINQEISIYLAQGKISVLKGKLADAIQSAPDNEVLHAVLANICDKMGDKETAVKEYTEALNIKPDFELANYNLGILYFNIGNDWNTKMNALPLSESKKMKEYEATANDYFRKAVVNMEKSYEISPDKAIKQRLRQLCLRLGETEKAEKYK